MPITSSAAFHILLLLAVSLGCASSGTCAAEADDCGRSASATCYFSFEPGGAGGRMHYYASRPPDSAAPETAPVRALIAVHGHSRDATRAFNAALLAVQRRGDTDNTLIVAPLFQVAEHAAAGCRYPGVPSAQTGDLLWTCGTWSRGGPAQNGSGITSFAAMDAVIVELRRNWPSLRAITIAGFSAGGQMVQRYIGFARIAPATGVAIRYVVADPSSWLYFDDLRPQPMLDGRPAQWSECGGGQDALGNCMLEFRKTQSECAQAKRWKYGTAALPGSLQRSAAEARARYAEADISYLEGALDSSAAPGASYGILDKSCAAMAQGPFRLQRGLAYAEYDRRVLAPGRPRKLVVVPGCAHSVTCVFSAEAARAALLGP